MSKIFFIYEKKTVVYTYKVYAKTKKEALKKFNNFDDYKEICFDQVDDSFVDIEESGKAIDNCAICRKKFSPENVSDYLCKKCNKSMKAARL